MADDTMDSRRGIGPQTKSPRRMGGGGRSAANMKVPGVGEVTTPPGNVDNRSGRMFADVIPGVTSNRSSTTPPGPSESESG